MSPVRKLCNIIFSMVPSETFHIRFVRSEMCRGPRHWTQDRPPCQVIVIYPSPNTLLSFYLEWFPEWMKKTCRAQGSEARQGSLISQSNYHQLPRHTEPLHLSSFKILYFTRVIIRSEHVNHPFYQYLLLSAFNLIFLDKVICDAYHSQHIIHFLATWLLLR